MRWNVFVGARVAADGDGVDPRTAELLELVEARRARAPSSSAARPDDGQRGRSPQG